MNKLNWNNIPIPEGHVTLLGAGIALHFWRPLPLFQATWPVHLFGWPLLLLVPDFDHLGEIVTASPPSDVITPLENDNFHSQ